MSIHPKITLQGKKKAIPVVLMSLIVAGITAWYLLTDRNVLTGEVEATIVPVHSEVGGKILEIRVEPGQHIEKGDVIAVLDNSDQTYALKQLELTLERQEAGLSELERGAEEEAIRQAADGVRIAEENYNSAKSTYELARSDGKNARSLYQEGAISRTSYDQALHQETLSRNAMSAALDQLQIAREGFTLLQRGASEEKLIQARAEAEQTRLKIQQAREDLEKFTVLAPVSGTVISRNFVVGDLVDLGANLADLSDEQGRRLVAYLPERALSQVNYGDRLTVKGEDGSVEHAVTFLDIQAQYTPKELQTAANKDQNSFRMELALDASVPWKPGTKAKILLPQ